MTNLFLGDLFKGGIWQGGLFLSSSMLSVTYSGNENTAGTAPADENQYAPGDSVTVLGNSGTLEKTGYSFAGWNTAANGSGTDYAPDATFEITENITLYAKWTEVVTYSVTYLGNSNDSGTVPTDSTEYESGDTVTVLDNTGTLVRTGYTFSGWNTAADGSGTDYAAAATLEISGDVTLYAKWGAATYTAKAVIIDIADSWGGAFMGIRSCRFYLDGVLQAVTSGFTAYATSSYSASYLPANTFNTGSSLIGAAASAQWYSSDGSTTNQRLTLSLSSQIEFDEIRINNSHTEGLLPEFGAKNIKIYIAPEESNSTTYEQAVANYVKIFDGQLAQHVAVNKADDQILNIGLSVSSVKSAVIDIVDNWGDANYTSIRSVEFYNGESLITMTSGFAAYATSIYSSHYAPLMAFSTNLSKTGSDYDTSWRGNATNSLRLSIVFSAAQYFDKIVINNGHASGGGTTYGAKNIKIYKSYNTITSTVYNEAIANSTLIFDGQLAQHVAADQADDQVLDLI